MTRLLFFALILLACNNNNKNASQDDHLSILIFPDSVVVYNGNLDKNTPITRTIPDEEKIKKILSDNKNEFGNRLQVLLKVADKGGIMENVNNIQHWIKETGISRFSLVDPDGNDKTIFGISPFPWSFFDSLSHASLDLKEPKYEKDNLPAEPPTQERIITSPSIISKTLSVKPSFFLLLKSDGSICYKTDSLDQKGAYISLIKNNSILLSNLIVAYKEKCNSERIPETIYIMGEQNSKYKTFEFVIEALKKNGIYKYNLTTIP